MEEKDKKTDNETKENTGNQSENNENHDDISNEKKDKIGDETLVNQDEIRPEIQELIDSSNINGDRFENVMDLTKAEAIEIANKARGYSINLSGIKKIDVETFEELLNFKGLISIGITDLIPELANKIYENEKKNKNGKLIIFTGLENISNIETYKILGKTYGTLKFLSLKSITEEGMGELVKKPGGDIYLDAIESITPKISENLLKYPREISLKGIKKIDKQTAEVLSQKKEGRICLNGLEAPLDEDVIEGLSKIPAQIFTQNGLNNEVFTQVYNYKKQKEREGKNLSKIVLDVLDNKINISELSKLDSITNDDAEFLDKMGKSFYDLSGIKTIIPEIFETLLKCRGLIEIGITDLTPELAKKIEESGKSITFAGLEKIDNMETYRILGKTKGILRFKKLKTITGDEMGELVKKPGGDIHFESVEEIDSSIAEKIAVYPRDISFNGVKKIDKETADALSKKKNGIIYLNGLEAPLDEDVIECISKIPGRQLRTNNNIVTQIYDYKKQKEKLEK